MYDDAPSSQQYGAASNAGQSVSGSLDWRTTEPICAYRPARRLSALLPSVGDALTLTIITTVDTVAELLPSLLAGTLCSPPLLLPPCM